jgi:hypothetical protein
MASSTKSSATSGAIVLDRLEDVVVTAMIEGVTPVIPHRWSEKAIAMMADKQQNPGRRTKQREAKNPEQEAFDSCYWLARNGDGSVPAMPSTAFKAAMVTGARFFDQLTMTSAKQLVYVEGEGPDQLVEIQGERHLREDTPRNANGTADLRYRYAFFPWRAELRIRFLPHLIDPDSVLTLLDAGGRGGVGDWRPSSPRSSTGTFGQFRVVSE